MPFLQDLEKSSEKELEGGFRVSGKNVNLWVRIYQTEFGAKARITLSYFEEGRWITTPPLWIDKKLAEGIAGRMSVIADMLS